MLLVYQEINYLLHLRKVVPVDLLIIIKHLQMLSFIKNSEAGNYFLQTTELLKT